MLPWDNLQRYLSILVGNSFAYQNCRKDHLGNFPSHVSYGCQFNGSNITTTEILTRGAFFVCSRHQNIACLTNSTTMSLIILTINVLLIFQSNYLGKTSDQTHKYNEHGRLNANPYFLHFKEKTLGFLASGICWLPINVVSRLRSQNFQIHNLIILGEHSIDLQRMSVLSFQ